MKISLLLVSLFLSLFIFNGCQSYEYYKAKHKSDAAERKWLKSDVRYDTNSAALYEEYSLDYFNMINLEK